MCNLALQSALGLEGWRWECDAWHWTGLQAWFWELAVSQGFQGHRLGWTFEKKHERWEEGQAWELQEPLEGFHEHTDRACQGYVAFNKALGKQERLLTNDIYYATGEVTLWANSEEVTCGLNPRKGRFGRNGHLVPQHEVLQTPVLGLMFNIFLNGLEKVVQANCDNVYDWWNVI